jgi:hypothetical protein
MEIGFVEARRSSAARILARLFCAAALSGVTLVSCSKSPTAPRQNSAPTVSVQFQGVSTCAARPGSPCTLEVVAQATDPDGDTLQYSWSGCATGGQPRATCTVTAAGQVVASVAVDDGHGHNVTATATGQGTDVPNAPPIVSVVFDGASTCSIDGSRPCTLTVLAQATDPDGDALTYLWSGCAAGTSARAACSVTRTGPAVASVEVRDGHDHTVSASAAGEGRDAPNGPPVVTVTFQGASSCTPQIGRPCTLEVLAQASDPDGDTLRYTWSGCASGSSSKVICTVERPGDVIAAVDVSDGRGYTTRGEATARGGGSNRPPGLQIGYITLLPTNSTVFNILGNVIDPDEGFLCGYQYCAAVSAAGSCRATGWLDCTCLGGLETEVVKTANTGMCTVTLTVKDSWGQTGTPSVTFDVQNPKPWVIK